MSSRNRHSQELSQSLQLTMSVGKTKSVYTSTIII